MGKPAKITIKNVPKGADIEWYWYATDASIEMMGTSKANTVKVTVLIDGIEEAEVYAIVDGVTYTTKLIME